MIQILYNNNDPFSGVAPVPLISQKNTFIKYDEQWGEVTRITLNGVLTGAGCANITYIDGGYNFTGSSGNIIDGGNFFSGNSGAVDGGTFYAQDGNLFINQQYLITNFSKDFQSLQVNENNVNVLNKPYCKIINIDFPTSNYVKLLPFQIDIDCYESGFFSGVYGILEPRNEFSFTQNKDQSVTIEHTMSCRGFNTSSNNSNALQNARNYIASISGYTGATAPYFIKTCSGIQPSLIAAKENINRVQSTYAVSETYIFDPLFSSGLLRYTATYDSGIADGLSNVNINGSLRSSINLPINSVRNRYQNFDSFSAAVDIYSGATNGLLDLNPFYLSSGVSEDSFANTINFQILFNNDKILNPYLDYNITFNRNNIADITEANFKGTIKGRGDLNTRYQQVLNYYPTVNPYNLTFTEYVQDGYQYTLNPSASSQSIIKNPYAGEISLAATYDDAFIPPSGFDSLDYAIAIKPAIRAFSAVPLLNGSGSYMVTNLGYVKREILTIQGSAVYKGNLTSQSGISLLSNYINYLVNQYTLPNRLVIENQEITFGNLNVGRNLSFNAEFSFENNEVIL